MCISLNFRDKNTIGKGTFLHNSLVHGITNLIYKKAQTVVTGCEILKSKFLNFSSLKAVFRTDFFSMMKFKIPKLKFSIPLIFEPFSESIFFFTDFLLKETFPIFLSRRIDSERNRFSCGITEWNIHNLDDHDS